jgi:hypothetical protein
VELRAALRRLYHDEVLRDAVCGGIEKQLYSIISYGAALSNEANAVRTPEFGVEKYAVGLLIVPRTD